MHSEHDFASRLSTSKTVFLTQVGCEKHKNVDGRYFTNALDIFLS